MRSKLSSLVCMLLALGACSTHDPILPGERTPIFDTNSPKILNQEIQNLEEVQISYQDCPYRQDSSNIIWKGDKKIFSGFPTSNSVKSEQKPVCSGKYIYAGLTTGELVKIDSSNRNIAWIADIYSNSNMTGGSSILDIIAPIVIYQNNVYVGGLGDAFCKVNLSGIKKWCVSVGTGVPFLMTNKAAFVVGTDNYLYAIKLSNGDVYWKAKVDSQVAPVLKDGVITVGKTKINASNGDLITEK